MIREGISHDAILLHYFRILVGKDSDVRDMFANRPGLRQFNSGGEAGLSFSVLECKKNKAKISVQLHTLWSH